MMRRPILLWVLILATVAACGADPASLGTPNKLTTSTTLGLPTTTVLTVEAPTTTATTTVPLDEFQECEDEPGGPLDVAGEPNWRSYADYRPWTDADGCLVRIDVLAERTGPDHCGWEDTRVLITGRPLGSRSINSETDLEYVRDPDGLYEMSEFVDGFQIDDALPSDAVDTGFRQGGRQLWVSPTDPKAVYIKTAESIERWPEGIVPLCN